MTSLTAKTTNFVVLKARRIAHNPEVDQLYPSKVEPCSALRTCHGCGSSVIIRNKTSTVFNKLALRRAASFHNPVDITTLCLIVFGGAQKPAGP